jgi:hypothetical protein
MTASGLRREIWQNCAIVAAGAGRLACVKWLFLKMQSRDCCIMERLDLHFDIHWSWGASFREGKRDSMR